MSFSISPSKSDSLSPPPPLSRPRKLSNVFVDAVHDLPEDVELAPAQLYSTESGRLFHAGRILIVIVGLPARGKTHISVAITRYLRWLGVKSHVFHLGDYRRAALAQGKEIPDDYFYCDASDQTINLRKQIVQQCRNDILRFLEQENGQVAIYDAVNPIAKERRELADDFKSRNVKTMFIESLCTDESIIEGNLRRLKFYSPDYQGPASDDEIKQYLARISQRIPVYQAIEEPDLHWIKMVNAGQRVIVNNCAFGYLSQRIVFYLLNLQTKFRRIYLVRAGPTVESESSRVDAPLSSDGVIYADKMCQTLLEHREKLLHDQNIKVGDNHISSDLAIWTCIQKRSRETAAYMTTRHFPIRCFTQLSPINPGVCEGMTDDEIRQKFPEDSVKHLSDPYHHRFPRAESYHDLAVRLEPVIFEREREKNDLLVIAHESVLRVLYGYLMTCHATDISTLRFPRHEIVQIDSDSYQNIANRIQIPNLPESIHLSDQQSLINPSLFSE